MNNAERRRIGSIPQRTMRDVWREQANASSVRLGGTSLGIGGLGTGVPRQSRLGEDHSFDVRPYVSPKPRKEKPRKTLIFPESERITWQVEQIPDYNGRDLGLILQFTGIDLAETSFLRGRRYYRPDVTLFYSPISYQNKRALLILATIGDIFESQVVPAQKDVNPVFQEELYLPHLATTHNPTSMAVQQNNGLVIVSYNQRSY